MPPEPLRSSPSSVFTSAIVLLVALRPTQPDREPLATELGGVLATEQLQHAHQRRRALELIEREQA